MLGKCKRCQDLEKQLAITRTELSDLRGHSIQVDLHHLTERRDLLDRIMLLTSPNSVRELRMEPIKKVEHPKQLAKLNLPGDRPRPRKDVPDVLESYLEQRRLKGTLDKIINEN